MAAQGSVCWGQQHRDCEGYQSLAWRSDAQAEAELFILNTDEAPVDPTSQKSLAAMSLTEASSTSSFFEMKPYVPHAIHRLHAMACLHFTNHEHC